MLYQDVKRKRDKTSLGKRGGIERGSDSKNNQLLWDLVHKLKEHQFSFSSQRVDEYGLEVVCIGIDYNEVSVFIQACLRVISSILIFCSGNLIFTPIQPFYYFNSYTFFFLDQDLLPLTKKQILHFSAFHSKQAVFLVGRGNIFIYYWYCDIS